MAVEWDPAKDKANRKKHGISFDEAKELFESGVEYLEIYDADHSELEDRFLAIGPIRRGVALIVWTERVEDTIRILSARWATKSESDLYAEFARGLNDE